MLETAGWRQSFCCRWAGSALITATLLSACGDHQEAGLEYRSGSSPELAPSQRLLYLSEQYLALSGANDDFLTNAAGTVERVLPDRSYAGVKLAATMMTTMTMMMMTMMTMTMMMMKLCRT